MKNGQMDHATIKDHWRRYRRIAVERLCRSRDQITVPVTRPLSALNWNPKEEIEPVAFEVLTFRLEFGWRGRHKAYRIMCDGFEVECGPQ